MIKSILKLFIGLLIILPIIFILLITQTELKKYEPLVPESFGNKAYGTVEPVDRRNIDEVIIVKGEYISNKYEYIDFKINNENSIKQYYKVGEEVVIDDIIISINKKYIITPWNGIISEINTESPSGYIKIQKVNNLIFEGYLSVNSPRLEINQTYKTKENVDLTVIKT